MWRPEDNLCEFVLLSTMWIIYPPRNGLSFLFFFSVPCVYMFFCTCVDACLHMSTCVCMVDVEAQQWPFHLVHWSRVSKINLELTDMAPLTIQLVLGIPRLHLSRLESQAGLLACCPPSIYVAFWGSEFPSSPQGKHLNYWAISLVPRVNFYRGWGNASSSPLQFLISHFSRREHSA